MIVLVVDSAINKTVLMEACEKREFTKVRNLLESGANVLAMTADGSTALTFASSSEGIRKLLRDAEAKYIPTNEGTSISSLVWQCSSIGC